MAGFIRAVKRDEAGPALLAEFHDRVDAGPGESTLAWAPFSRREGTRRAIPR